MCQIVLGDDEADAQNGRGRLFVIPADAPYVGGHSLGVSKHRHGENGGTS
jgi:hypothetical protein